MAWLSLLLAGGFEMLGVTMISKWNTDRKWYSFVLMVAGFGASFLFLSLAMRTISMGVAYAIWTGIGACGAAIVGMAVYGESRNGKRIFFISLILAATIGLKLTE